MKLRRRKPEIATYKLETDSPKATVRQVLAIRSAEAASRFVIKVGNVCMHEADGGTRGGSGGHGRPREDTGGYDRPREGTGGHGRP